VSQGDRGLTPGLTDRPSHRHSLAESDRQTEASLIKISPQDMSRRKQRNPKSLGGGPASEPDTVKQEPEETSHNEPEPEPADVSNLVKVELAGSEEVDLNLSTESLPSPRSGAPMLPGVEDVMRKWNMFQLGEVTVPNHPNVPVVPMALQMVYLYPTGRGEGGEVKYKMLVPMGAGLSPPMFQAGAASPPMHLQLPGFPQTAAVPRGRPPSAAAASSPEPGPSKPHHNRLTGEADDIKQSPPLDLTNKSPEHSADKDDISVKRPTQQMFLESHMNLIKMKELELLKNPPHPPPLQAVNRCNECNINFSKYQNYMAHKKYYCSGMKGANNNDTDSEPDTPKSIQAPKSRSPRSSSTSPVEATLMTRELMLKQQEALLANLKAGAPPPPLPLLIPNPRLPNPMQPTSLFGCEGCGISFKSISNLQAHQSRYCAGIKKSEELKFLEAIMKSGQMLGGGAAPPSTATSSGQSSPNANASALSEMLALLSARKAETEAANSADKAAKGLVGTAATTAEAADKEEEVFCKICGLKESREKLMEHVYGHLIGVSGKKRKAEDDATPPPDDNNRLKPDKRIKAEPEPEKKEGQRCENCGITFSKPTAYKAHVEFYCQKKIKKE